MAGSSGNVSSCSSVGLPQWGQSTTVPMASAGNSRWPPQFPQGPFRYFIRLILAPYLQLTRNQTLAFSVLYVIDTFMSPDNKYIREHSARLGDFFVTRRQFLQRAGMGLGALSLAALLGEELVGVTGALGAEASPNLAPRNPPMPARAKHVVHIF